MGRTAGVQAPAEGQGDFKGSPLASACIGARPKLQKECYTNFRRLNIIRRFPQIKCLPAQSSRLKTQSSMETCRFIIRRLRRLDI